MLSGEVSPSCRGSAVNETDNRSGKTRFESSCGLAGQMLTKDLGVWYSYWTQLELDSTCCSVANEVRCTSDRKVKSSSPTPVPWIRGTARLSWGRELQSPTFCVLAAVSSLCFYPRLKVGELIKQLANSTQPAFSVNVNALNAGFPTPSRPVILCHKISAVCFSGGQLFP